MHSAFAAFVIGVVLAGLSFPLLAADSSGGTAIVTPWSNAPQGNAALFVGVNKFKHGLSPLHYAVDDAVEQAHLFVVELRLIPPSRCWLALSGEPANNTVSTHLTSLEKSGVHVCGAELTDVIDALRKATGEHAPEDMIVVSFSSHGCETGEKGYAMLADSFEDMPESSALCMGTVEALITGSHCHAGKRLLLIDCCRSNPQAEDGSRSIDGGMGASFLKAFNSAYGQVVLNSCTVGQKSFERSELGHGVFTYFLLEALHGGAKGDQNGYITLGSVTTYVADKVENRILNDVGVYQVPCISGTMDKGTTTMPLAVLGTGNPNYSVANSSVAIPHTDRFQITAENTIKDATTGKTWIVLRKPSTYTAAKKQAEHLNARLPTIKELQCLMTTDTYQWDDGTEVHLDTRVFPKMELLKCWTCEKNFPNRIPKYFDIGTGAHDTAPSSEETMSVMLIQDR